MTESAPLEKQTTVPVLMAEPPETGDLSALFLVLGGMSGTGLAGMSLLEQKKRGGE